MTDTPDSRPYAVTAQLIAALDRNTRAVERFTDAAQLVTDQLFRNSVALDQLRAVVVDEAPEQEQPVPVRRH